MEIILNSEIARLVLGKIGFIKKRKVFEFLFPRIPSKPELREGCIPLLREFPLLKRRMPSFEKRVQARELASEEVRRDTTRALANQLAW